jgi:hypothetical protein
MRTILGTGVLALLLLAGCRSSEVDVSEGTAGDGFEQLSRIDRLAVLPVKLPTDFHGNYDLEKEDRYRSDWPMAGARLIADGVTDETDGRTRALAAAEKPSSGHYFVLEISYLDLGDPEIRVKSALDDDKEGWSHVIATGRIMNAETGDLVVELTFSQSSGWGVGPPFENDMAAIGEKLGEWLNERR